MQRRSARHWIDGRFVSGGNPAESHDPATGEAIGSYQDGGASECAAAIEAARGAFEHSPWRGDHFARSAALSHLADAFEAARDVIVDTLCLENGKLRDEALYEWHFVPRTLRYTAGLAMHMSGRAVEPQPGQQSLTLREPVGVAGVITPWNSPIYLAMRSIAPALAAGCTVVVKFPHQSAQAAQVMSEVFAQVDEIPPGVVNVFVESGSAGAELLVSSPDVPVVSYTGSTAVGRVIARSAADHLKRVSLELGGKSPHIVLADADLDAAIPQIVASSTVFAGQFCIAGSRVLVQRDIADELQERLASALRAVRPGPAADPASQMGPLVDKEAVRRVDEVVERAVADGAVVLERGGPVRDGAFAAGAFYRPTLLAVVDNDLDIVQKETFGPVQTVQVFDTEDEAVALANSTEFGLGASIWSEDIEATMRLARRVEAGLISINSWGNLAMESEEGGYKASGLGRLSGQAQIEDFVEYKQITQNYATGARS